MSFEQDGILLAVAAVLQLKQKTMILTTAEEHFVKHIQLGWHVRHGLATYTRFPPFTQLFNTRVISNFIKTNTPEARRLERDAKQLAAHNVDPRQQRCEVCLLTVVHGIRCTCQSVWHFGCAARQTSAVDISHIPFQAFRTKGMHAFKCLKCTRGQQLPMTDVTLVRLRKKVEGLEWHDAWKAIGYALEAGATRRRLPGNHGHQGVSRAGYLCPFE